MYHVCCKLASQCLHKRSSDRLLEVYIGPPKLKKKSKYQQAFDPFYYTLVQ